jgi:general secretion pathway protein I
MSSPSAGSTAPSASSRGEAGFALIESLVALAVLALTLGVLFATGAAAARRMAEAEAVSFATLAAQSVLAAAGIERPLAVGTRRGTLPQGFTFTETTAPLSGTPQARTITVSVADPAGRMRAELSTVRLAPP